MSSREPKRGSQQDTTTRYTVVTTLSVHQTSYFPGGRLKPSDLAQLPLGRLGSLLSGGWLRARLDRMRVCAFCGQDLAGMRADRVAIPQAEDPREWPRGRPQRPR